MVNPQIATSAEQPINSDGATAVDAGSEGDLVGLNTDGELVTADAASGEQVAAVGALAGPVDDPANWPSEDSQFNYARQQALSNRAVIGDTKVGFIRYGVEVYNNDQDWGFTPGEPVYLDVGGGFTQTEPSASGELVQIVGFAGPDGETVFLEIDADYETLA